MPAPIDLLGFVAAALTTFAFLPQVVRALATRSVRDLSLPMLASFALGVLLWLAYGILSAQPPVILANAVTLALVLVLLVLKLRDAAPRA